MKIFLYPQVEKESSIWPGLSNKLKSELPMSFRMALFSTSEVFRNGIIMRKTDKKLPTGLIKIQILKNVTRCLNYCINYCIIAFSDFYPVEGAKDSD